MATLTPDEREVLTYLADSPAGWLVFVPAQWPPLDALVVRGLAAREPCAEAVRYTITEAGRVALEEQS